MLRDLIDNMANRFERFSDDASKYAELMLKGYGHHASKRIIQADKKREKKPNFLQRLFEIK